MTRSLFLPAPLALLLTILLLCTAWAQQNLTDCGVNARVVECGTTCPLGCHNVQSPPKVCTLACFNGCRCRPGYVFRNGTSGDCIHPRDCPHGF